MITIGLDPHPDSHTVAALDENGTTLASLTVSNDAGGLARLHQFARSFPKRRWAIEGAANRFILPFVCELLKQGKTVHPIPPNLTRQYRARLSRRTTLWTLRMPPGRYWLILNCQPFDLAKANGSFKISPERNDACPSNSKLTGWLCKHSIRVPLLALP